MELWKGSKDDGLEVVFDETLLKLVFEGDSLSVVHPEPKGLHQLGEVLGSYVAIAMLVHSGHPAVVLMTCLEMHPA